MFHPALPVAFRRLSTSLKLLLGFAMLIGLAERIGWAVARRTPWATGEAPYVAIALARGRGFADAFWPDQGPTAHVLPTTPAIAGGVYALLGIRTPFAEAVLCGWSLLLTAVCYLAFAAAFARIGLRRTAVIGGLVFLCVAPIYTTSEVFEFRVWDGGLGLALAAANLALLLAAEDGWRPRWLRWAQALLPALAFFVDPAAGVAAFAASALFVWRHRAQQGLLRPAGAALCALALLIGPWTLRNELAMGHPIPLRDDFGMELAMGNYPQAVDPADPDATHLLRLQAIQPYIHPAPYHAMWVAGGEVAYSKLLQRQTVAWMKAHPGDVARIWVRHLREMLFTRTWMFSTQRGHYVPILRAALVSTAAIFALVGLALAAWRRDARYLYAAASILVPVPCYMPFQPVARYAWLVYPPLVYAAADAIERIVRSMRRRQSSSSS